MLAFMSNQRLEQKDWLRRVMQQTRMSATRLAAAAKVAQTTLTRFVHDPDWPHELSPRTIRKIEAVTGIAFAAPAHQSGMREAEAAPYDASADSMVQRMLASVTGGLNGIDPWQLQSRALDAAGYLPGDVLIVDMNATAEAGDIVCAQVYDWQNSRAETIFRIFQPPYLISATGDLALQKPHVVDGNNVIVRGAVIAAVRPRHRKAA